MDLGFKGKTVIITGGTKGIGSGISRVFAQEGANLVINYRSDNEGSSTKFIEDLKAEYGVRAIGVHVAVGTEEAANMIFDAAQKEFGRLDVLVNNAAGNVVNKMCWDITLDEWNAAMQNNTTAYFINCKEFANRVMAEGHGARIVNLLSKASLTTTTKGHMTYVTNKTAQMGLTKQLAVDLTDKGIICNGIMPGTVMNQSFAKISEEAYKARLKRLPTGRFGQPEEFGKMVAFLASEQCQLAVGSVVDFTGGMMLGF